MRKVLLDAAATAIAVCVGGASASLAQEVPPGNAVEGRRLYMAVGCFLCHGRAGQGGFLNGPAPSVAKTEMPFEGFKGQLRQPVNDMPAYVEDLMSDKQIADIYAFVRSLPGPLPAKDMPIFKD